jgi:hypothetical protein
LQDVPTQEVNEEMKVGERQMQVVFEAGQLVLVRAFSAQVNYTIRLDVTMRYWTQKEDIRHMGAGL